MKLFRLMAIISLLTLFATGCSIDSKSPDELINDKPIYNENKKEIYNGIKQLLSQNYELILPANSKEVGIINEVDLNRDGDDELVAFEKKKNINENKTEVGFMVLTKNKDGGYTDKGNSLQEGDSIEYANFYDLNNDGNLEIILLIKNKNKTNLYVYEFIDGKINLVTELNPTWIPNQEDLLDTKIKIGYMNEDNILDILIVNYDIKQSKAYVSLVNLEENFKLIDFIGFENVRNINNMYITLGQVFKGKQGIILDIPVIKDSSYITQILYVENNKLKKVFKNDDITKPYYIPVEDINNDKILEIPIANGSPNVYSLNSSENVSWYKWNGKYDEYANLTFINQIHYNYKYNYKLLIPNNLVGKFYIEQDYLGDNVLFKFFYRDIDSKSKHIFTITVVPKTRMEDNKNLNLNNQGDIILGENYDYTFNLHKSDVKKLEELNITVETIKECFSLIY